MYKLEEKKRAVELYIKSGKKVGPVIRALGYPSPGRLRDWYKELCETGVLHGDVRSKFTTEQRERALEYWRTHDYNIRATINALGYPGYTTLTEWIEKYVGDDERADCILKRGVVNYIICLPDASAKEAPYSPIHPYSPLSPISPYPHPLTATQRRNSK